MSGTADDFDPRRRVIGVTVVFALAALGLVAQLLHVQVLDSERYVAWGDDQRLQYIPLEGQRGELLDRNGQELAVSLPHPVIVADPQLIEDPAAAAAALAPVLGREQADVHSDLTAQGRFVYLQRPTTDLVADQVLDLAIPGVSIRSEPRRFLPSGESLARGIIGLVGVDNVGLSGIEAQFNSELSGIPGRLVAERSIDGRTIPDGVIETLPAIQGNDVLLSIDRALQFQVELALAEHVAATGSKGGIVVITDPGTGDILAMASVARTEDGDIVTTPDNRALTWTYEPASVMKAVTFAGVIDNGVATPESTLDITDSVQIYDDVFTDDEVYGTMSMSVKHILVRSSNTGTITWARELGSERLHANLKSFGFGSPTGLDFPGESGGLLAEAGDWSGTSFATISIGQGIAVTPMQMVTAYSVLANDGVYVAPRLVIGTSDESGIVVPAPPSPTRRVVSADTAKAVSEMLTAVVEGGTATDASVPGYTIAAKTGTARKVQETGGYLDGAGNYNYIATVTGFFPVESPEFSMIVILDEPDETYASRTAAPLFGELAAWTLRHYQVTPASAVVFTAPSEGSPETEPGDELAVGGE